MHQTIKTVKNSKSVRILITFKLGAKRDSRGKTRRSTPFSDDEQLDYINNKTSHMRHIYQIFFHCFQTKDGGFWDLHSCESK